MKDKVKKWVLPVEETKVAETDETEYFVSFPDDLLESANLKEGDQVEWVDNGDGSYLLRKVIKPLGMDEC
jgi:bifunctional DNA-binding transcriptional regulator/antitoxin component of YhaV-PrlF toxin-antitoxin module